MYHPIPNGTTEEVQGLKCHLPPKGSILNPLTRKVEQINIYKRSTVPSYNYWEKDRRWDDYFDKWDKWLHEEKIMQAKKEGYEHPELKKTHPKLKIRNRAELDEFIQDCWKFRLGGFWFSNNGEATYITGRHWYYLSCYNLDGGLPTYRDIDKEFFYFWEYCANDPKCFGMVEVTKRRNGKCFKINTLIRMADGSTKPVQDIADGEYVMGDDSRPRMVYGTTSGREEMFEVTPNFGEPFTCNASHILSLKWNGVYSPKNNWTPDQTINISVRDYMDLKDWEKSHLVLYRAGWEVENPNDNFTIPPYLLGAYLGDGCCDGKQFTSADPEIVEYLHGYCSENGLKLSPNGSNRYGYRINKKTGLGIGCSVVDDGVLKEFDSVVQLRESMGLGEDFRPHRSASFTEKYKYKANGTQQNKYCSALRALGVLEDKHIPVEYLRASRLNRLDLLAGLVDTDGHYTGSSFEITQKRKRLAEDIAELAQSLGFYARIKEKVATMKRSDGSVYRCEVYRVNICGAIEEIPCKVERKKATTNPKRRTDITRSGFKIKSVGEDDYYGFAVDGNHLFLLASGIVVHNSYRGGCIGLEWASRMAEFNVGIQSKTDIDAEKLFKKTIIAPFRKLPFFFMPMTDLPHSGKAPAKWLKFYSGKVSTDEDELESMIDFQASGAMAYDGQKLGYAFLDEEGKTKTVNINDRWEVVRFCLKDHTGKKIGTAYHTTTVEDMDSGGKEFLDLWKGSDHYHKVGEETPTGLYRFFMPADRTRHMDKYGKSNTEKARAEILQERLAVEDNPRVLSQRKRKEPLEEREAFQADAESCVFSNPVKLNERYDELKWVKPQYKVGNFQWKGGERDADVEFVEAPNGRFMVMWEPPEEMRNLCIKRADGFEPNNKEHGCVGIDPYDHTFLTKESEKRMSMGAICGVKKFSPLIETPVDNAPAFLYLTRPDMPHMFYEDAIMVLKYYGWQALIENNKANIFDYFNDRGYSRYAAWLPGKDKPGIGNFSRSKGGGVNGYIAEIIDQFLNDHLQNVYFEVLIEQILEFTPIDTTKYDAVMAFGYALMLQKSVLSKMNDRKDTQKIENYLSWFKRRN